MKKLIAGVLSAVLMAAAVAGPVSAQAPAPGEMINDLANREVSGQIRAVSPQECEEVLRSVKGDTERASGVNTPHAVTGEMIVLPSGTQEQTQSQTMIRSNSAIPKPTLAQVEATVVVLQKVEGYEYSQGGHSWTTNNVFKNLSPNSTYQFYQRKAGNADAVSPALEVKTTDRVPCTVTPVAPQLADYYHTSIYLVHRDGYEYRVNHGPWQSSAHFSNLQPDTWYTFEQRVKQTDAEYASEASETVKFKTAKLGPSSYINCEKLEKYIDANGTEDEYGDMTLAYTLEDSTGADYYFIVSNVDEGIYFGLVSISPEVTCVDYCTEFVLTPGTNSFYVDNLALLYVDGECVDEVYNSLCLYPGKYTGNYAFNGANSGYYLTSDDISQLYGLTMELITVFWDECFYEELGFGMKGIGFTAYDGLGESFCDPGSDYHIGQIAQANVREAGCAVDGHNPDEYCQLCGHKVTHNFDVLSRGYHVYDNDCDPDCNDCGEERHIDHIYSYACATECDLCGAVREKPLGSHTLSGTNCIHCGAEVRLPGDINGDGKVNIGDVAKLHAHVRRKSLLTDPVALAVADVNGDGKINLGDTARLFAHATQKELLW